MCARVCAPGPTWVHVYLCPHAGACGAGLSGTVEAERPRSRLRQPQGVGVGPRRQGSLSLPARSLPPPRHNHGNPRASLGSGQPGLCGAELPTRAVVQSAGRAPSGAAGSSGCGEAALCDLPCLSWCVLGGRTPLPSRGLTHRKPGWGAGTGGGATPGTPPFAGGCRPRCSEAAAVLPTALGASLDQGPLRHSHVWQEAQCLLWGLRMVGNRWEGG